MLASYPATHLTTRNMDSRCLQCYRAPKSGTNPIREPSFGSLEFSTTGLNLGQRRLPGIGIEELIVVSSAGGMGSHDPD